MILPSFCYNVDKEDCDKEYYYFIHFLQMIGVKWIHYMIYIGSEGFWELRDGVSTRAILAQFEHVQK